MIESPAVRPDYRCTCQGTTTATGLLTHLEEGAEARDVRGFVCLAGGLELHHRGVLVVRAVRAEALAAVDEEGPHRNAPLAAQSWEEAGKGPRRVIVSHDHTILQVNHAFPKLILWGVSAGREEREP